MPIAPDSEKRERIFRYFMLAFMVVIFLFYFWGLINYIPGRFMRQLMPMVMWGVIGMCAYKGVYGKWSVYTMGIGFLLWYYITRCLNGDAFLNFSYNWAVEFFLVYGVVFPFAKAVGEGEKRTSFDVVAILTVVTLLIMAVPGIVCAATGETVEYPLLGVNTIMRRGRLTAMGLICNGVAALMNIGLFLTIYLVAAYRKRWLAAPGILVALIFFMAGSLTVSRAGLAARAVGLGVVAFVFSGRIPLKKRWLKSLVMVLVLLVGSLVAYKLTDVSVDALSRISHALHLNQTQEETAPAGDASAADEIVVEEAAAEEEEEIQSVAQHRSALTGIGTLNGRINIYKAFFNSLKEQPEVLFKGVLDNDVMELAGRYQAWHYLHNSFLQVLAQTGVLGLLFVLVLCVMLFMSALKILLAENRSMGQKMLPILMVPLLLHGVLESFLFVTWRPLTLSSFVNICFFLCAGYTMEMAKGITWKDILRKEK